MAISQGNDGRAESLPIAAGTPVPASAPTLSRHALRPATGPAVPVPPAAADADAAQSTAPAAHPGTFWNLPNTITALRAAVVPVLLLYPLFPGAAGSTVMAWIFIVAAVSDLVDGWLARRGKQGTHIGVLLDPLAGKLLVSTPL